MLAMIVPPPPVGEPRGLITTVTKSSCGVFPSCGENTFPKRWMLLSVLLYSVPKHSLLDKLLGCETSVPVPLARFTLGKVSREGCVSASNKSASKGAWSIFRAD